jgi:hypothetical protein
MPLIAGCTYANPVGAALPAQPNAIAAPPLAPAQGDHLFGDVVGTIETALQSIFGGGERWQTRMRNYSAILDSLWAGLTAIDLGHGANPPVVQRNGAPEPDEHAHMFGGYSRRFQWHLCEIVCTGFVNGQESRQIGGSTVAWKNNVLAGFDDLLANLVDSTALAFYINTPRAIRAANPAAVRHPTHSLAVARTYANNNPGRPGQARVLQVVTAYDSLRGSLDGLLYRLDGPTKKLDPATNTWSRL